MCYLASILDLFAVNPAYLDLLDPAKNPPGTSADARTLQGLRTMALRVRSGGHVDADDVQNGVRILWRARMIADLVAEPDAANVFENMLRCLDRSGSQCHAHMLTYQRV